MKAPAYIYDRRQLPEVLTVAVAAAFCSVSEQTILNWIHADKLKGKIVERKALILRDDLLDFLGFPKEEGAA